MIDTLNAGSFDKSNGSYVPRLQGMELRNTQQRLLAALLRRPSLVPTTLRSGIRQDDFPEDLQLAFIVATKEPDRIKKIMSDPDGDPTIRRLYMRVVEWGDGQALRIAEQIVFNSRRIIAEERCYETSVEPDCAQYEPNFDPQTHANGRDDNAHGGNSEANCAGQSRKDAGEKKAADRETAARPEPEGEPDLAGMNAKYAVVKIGGKTRVVSFEKDATFPGCTVPVFSTISDFCAFHAKRKKAVRAKNGREKKIGIGRWWIDHEQRRQYDGIVYAPNSVAGDGKLNLWNGFGCKPREGDCGLFLDHLRNNICTGNEQYSEYFLNWMAYAVQHPHRQGEVAVVLRGKEGTGKGVVAKQFGRLLGSHFRHIVHAKHLTGHFNAHLQHCSVLFADEAFFAGDRSHEFILKALITEETLLIEPKGIDPFPVCNCVHLIMSSNNDWVVPAGADARRDQRAECG